jgi:ATP/ADP translocase
MLTTILVVLISLALFAGFIICSNRAEKRIEEEAKHKK